MSIVPTTADAAMGRALDLAGGFPAGDDWRVTLDIPQRPRTGWLTMAGVMVILLFLGGFGAWATLVPLASATVAQGQLRVEGNRRTVQHLEGGIIREFLVKDGARVAAGDVLMKLDDVQTAAASDNMRAQLDGALALEARLLAERDRLPQIRFPGVLLVRRGEPRVAEALNSQQTAFDSHRHAIDGQKAIFQQKIAQFRAQIVGSQGQIGSLDRQIALIQAELEATEPLVKRNVLPLPHFLALQREQAGLMGQRDKERGAIAQAEQGIGEAEMQMLQLENNLMNDVAKDLQDVRGKIADFEERLRGAADVQLRRELKAPIGGIVTNFRFFTVGGVVRQGEPILDIVPSDEVLVVDVRINPTDIDVVEVGQIAEIRLTAFRQRALPLLTGRVTYVSADVVGDSRAGPTDPQQGGEVGKPAPNSPFYRATVALDMDQIRRLEGVTLSAGMPAEVLIKAGERTFLSYLWQPIRDSLRRGFREQ